MERKLLVAALGVAFTLPATAWAEDDTFGDALASAKEAVLEESWSIARARLDAAEALAPDADRLLTPNEVAGIWFLRGAVEWHSGEKSAAFAAWRQALTLAPDLQPDPEILTDPADQDTVHALAEEVRAGTEVGLNIPEDAPEPVYVDGKKREAGDTALLGTHLVQVKCTDGTVEGAWHEYGMPPPNYFILCDGGSYPGAAKKKTAAKSSSKSSSASKSSSGASKSSSSSARTSSSSGKSRTTVEKKGGAGKDIAGATMLGLSAASGAATWYFYGKTDQAATVWQKKDQLASENPDLVDEANAYRNETLLPNYYMLLGSLGGTVLFAGTGITLILVDQDAPMLTPLPGGGGMLSWSGRF